MFHVRPCCLQIQSRPFGCFRRTFTNVCNGKVYELKYAEKLQKLAQSEGISVDKLLSHAPARSKQSLIENRISPSHSKDVLQALPARTRKDSPPIKPLTNIMDIRKIVAEGHSKEQVTNLWTGYHATRSQGTGRGYLSTVIPLDVYMKMVNMASKYPCFVLPLMHAPLENKKLAHELYFLQWDLYNSPPHPLRDAPHPDNSTLVQPSNPPCSTVLFTTLQEYKLRQTFALPYLVLTHYTDLAVTHDIVLMRGELTKSSSSQTYLLSQQDAQFLALGLQRFYLPPGQNQSGDPQQLLSDFHERSESFKWEDLLLFSDPSV